MTGCEGFARGWVRGDLLTTLYGIHWDNQHKCIRHHITVVFGMLDCIWNVRWNLTQCPYIQHLRSTLGSHSIAVRMSSKMSLMHDVCEGLQAEHLDRVEHDALLHQRVGRMPLRQASARSE